MRAQRTEHHKSVEVDPALGGLLDERPLFARDQVPNLALAGHNGFDQALFDGHRERRRLDEPVFARVGLNLEVSILAPLVADRRGIDRPELDRAVVDIPDGAPGAHDDPGFVEFERRRVEEVDVALFVVLRRDPMARERCLDLAIRDRRLDFNRVRAGH